MQLTTPPGATFIYRVDQYCKTGNMHFSPKSKEKFCRLCHGYYPRIQLLIKVTVGYSVWVNSRFSTITLEGVTLNNRLKLRARNDRIFPASRYQFSPWQSQRRGHRTRLPRLDHAFVSCPNVLNRGQFLQRKLDSEIIGVEYLMIYSLK